MRTSSPLGKRVAARLLPIVSALALAGCGAGFEIEVGGLGPGPDRPHRPDKPQRETGVFLIAGDPCTVCTATIDGTGSAARFNNPAGVAADGAGNLYVAEKGSSTIRKVTPQGVATTVAGSAGQHGSLDASGSIARLDTPTRIKADRDGNLYVTDLGNKTIRKITPAGVVTTLAGSPGVCGSADGSGALAQFCDPQGIALDRSGNLFVTDTGNHTVRKIDPAGRVTTVAGSAGVCGSADGRGNAAQFCQPQDIAVDRWGTLYVADTANSTVRKITLDGVVTTLAGRAKECGTADGEGTAARLCQADGIAIDDEGDLFVADSGSATIRRITRRGTVSTVAGVAGQDRVVLGPLPGAFKASLGIALMDTGTLAVTSQNLVLKVVTRP